MKRKRESLESIPKPGAATPEGTARFIAILSLFVLFALALIPTRAVAEVGEAAIHSSADLQLWDRHTNKMDLRGNAIVRQEGESLTADEIIYDRVSRTLDAKGNCTYIAEGTVIYGDEMHFNLDSRTGTVTGGRVVTDRFTLSGERLNKLGPKRYQTHWGEYSTCRDCAQSWTFLSRDVDMQIEGYAFMSDVVIKIKDSPVLWLPYLILPMKSHRQTGFLFPNWGVGSTHGFMFVEPFFWAINPSSDMTFGLGVYSANGLRAEWEGRYALTPRSGGKASVWYLNDRTFGNTSIDGVYNPSGNPNRWGLEASQVQELPYGFEEKLKIAAVSDNRYPFELSDISQVNESFLRSMGMLSYSSPVLVGNINARVYRNLLSLDPDTRKWDGTTVQALPTVTLATNDKFLAGTPLVSGITLSATRFGRPAGSFDKDFLTADPVPSYSRGVDPLREATRVILVPSMYTSIPIIDGLSLVPSAKYFNYYYEFVTPGVAPLYRGYPLLQLDLATQVERVFDTQNPLVPKRKHLIRPILSYSNIPFVEQDTSHPFLGQMSYLQNSPTNYSTGYNFDDNDIVPRDSSPFSQNYFIPLGNSVTYGFSTQLIEKVQAAGVDVPAYRTPVEFSAGQTFNFREFQVKSSNFQPFSRAFSTLITNYQDRFITTSQYYYYPYAPQVHHQLSTSATYILERGLHQRILAYDRSVSLSYTWAQVTSFPGTNGLTASLNFSLNDYILPTFSVSYDFVGHQLQAWALNLAFMSPSQCWRITTGISYNPVQGYNKSFPSVSLNLTGTGFEGVNDIAASGAAH